MRIIKVISGIFILLVISYLVSCDVVNQQNGTGIGTGTKMSSDNLPYDCPNPNNCSPYQHHCLVFTVDDPSTDEVETLDHETIEEVRVYQSGHDCMGQSYTCNYVTNLDGNGYGAGCFLPWSNSNCYFTRTIVLCPKNGIGSWQGSATTYYPNSTGYIPLTFDPNTNCR